MRTKKTYSPEQTSASNITNMRVTIQTLVKKLTQILSHRSYVRQQIILLYNLLHLVCSRTGNGVSLVCLTVDKSAGALTQSIDDVLVDEQSGNWGIASTKSFGNCLEVRDDVFLLPGMEGSGAAHAGHYFV